MPPHVRIITLFDVPIIAFLDMFLYLQSGMILRNYTYLKVYKCWQILPILKTPTIKCLRYFSKNILISKDFISFIL